MMTDVPSPDFNIASLNAVALAALELLARQDWDNLSLEQIAAQAALPPAEMQRICPAKDEIIPIIMGWVDREVSLRLAAPDFSMSAQDRLFDALMARFDVLQPHKTVILALTARCRATPDLALCASKAQIKSMGVLLENCFEKGSLAKPQKHLLQLVLLGVYHYSFLCWQRDTTPDLSPTMARVNQALIMTRIIKFCSVS